MNSLVKLGLLTVGICPHLLWGEMLGDVSGDGKLHSNDCVLVSRHLSAIQELTPEQKRLADVDGDGEVTQADLNLIFLKVVGTLTQDFPILVGDVNQNGKIQANDARLAARIASNPSKADAISKVLADVNGDQIVDAFDAKLIAQKAANIITLRFPVLIGDIDQDGSLTTFDAALIADSLEGKTEMLGRPLTAEERVLADADGNGRLTVHDEKLILRKSAGLLISSLPILLGDVNGNGRIQANDAALLAREIAGQVKFKLSKEQKERADMDINGVIDSNDLELMKQRLAGK